MIIDTSQGNTEVIGDVKEFKSSIDPRNLEFITTLLSSNLYSNPEQSFIREIVSNAWDSHVEAGTTDTPVIIKFGHEDRNNHSITIRDYGTGLSPERFNEIYRNIGSSTKRESNDYIGGFGIGHLSPFACSSTVYITSYHEGRAYYYVGSKLNNSITYYKLNEAPTSERNGVEVTIKGISNPSPYVSALHYITFFPNVYVAGINTADEINSVRLKKFTNFAAASIPIPHKLLLGNVLYPITMSHFSYEDKDFLNSLNNTGIVIRFDVGELNVTPNRESIIYTPAVIARIESRILDAKKELDGLIGNLIDKDYDDIKEWYNLTNMAHYYDPVDNSLSTERFNYTVYPRNMDNITVTYRGRDIVPYSSEIRAILYSDLPNYKSTVCEGKFYSKRLPHKVMGNCRIRSKKILVLNEGARMTAFAKDYISYNYDGYGIMTYISKEDFRSWVKLQFPSYSLELGIIDGIYESMMKDAVFLDLDNDSNYLKYKEQNKSCKTKSKPETRDIILYIWNNFGYFTQKKFTLLSTAAKYLIGLHKGVVLTGMQVPDIIYGKITSLNGYAFIKARKDVVTSLKELGLSCLVDLDWMLYKDPMLSVVRTLLKYYPKISIRFLLKIITGIDRELGNEFLRLSRIKELYCSEKNSYMDYADRDTIPYDDYTMYLCKRLKYYFDRYNELYRLSPSVFDESDAIAAAVIMKSKAYRISGEAYRMIKDNKLLKVLCRK